MGGRGKGGKGKAATGRGKGRGTDASGRGKGKGGASQGQGHGRGPQRRNADRVRGGFLNKMINIIESVGRGATPAVLRSIAQQHLTEEGSGNPYYTTIEICKLIIVAAEEGASIYAQRRAWEDVVRMCEERFVKKPYNEWNPRTADQVFGPLDAVAPAPPAPVEADEEPEVEDVSEDEEELADAAEEALQDDAAAEEDDAAAEEDDAAADEDDLVDLEGFAPADAAAVEAGEDTPAEQVFYGDAGASPGAEDDDGEVAHGEYVLPDEQDDWENRGDALPDEQDDWEYR